MIILMQFIFWGSQLLAPVLNWWTLLFLIPSGVWLIKRPTAAATAGEPKDG